MAIPLSVFLLRQKRNVGNGEGRKADETQAAETGSRVLSAGGSGGAASMIMAVRGFFAQDKPSNDSSAGVDQRVQRDGWKK